MTFPFDPGLLGSNVELLNKNQTLVAKHNALGWTGVVTKEAICPGELFCVRVDEVFNPGLQWNGLVSKHCLNAFKDDESDVEKGQNKGRR